MSNEEADDRAYKMGVTDYTAAYEKAKNIGPKQERIAGIRKVLDAYQADDALQAYCFQIASVPSAENISELKIMAGLELSMHNDVFKNESCEDEMTKNENLSRKYLLEREDLILNGPIGKYLKLATTNKSKKTGTVAWELLHKPFTI